MPDLLHFNAFGLMKISRQQITVNVSAVTNSGRSINRALTEELADPIPEIGPGEFAAVSFAAFLEPGNKARIALHELNALESGSQAADLPQVSQALSKVLGQLRKSTGLS